jgi:hypothetical protein
MRSDFPASGRGEAVLDSTFGVASPAGFAACGLPSAVESSNRSREMPIAWDVVAATFARARTGYLPSEVLPQFSVFKDTIHTSGPSNSQSTDKEITQMESVRRLIRFGIKLCRLAWVGTRRSLGTAFKLLQDTRCRYSGQFDPPETSIARGKVHSRSARGLPIDAGKLA